MKINPLYLDLIDGKIEGAYKFPFYFICHRIPNRTFKIKKYYFPVCARCTGIYISGFIYFFIATFTPIVYSIELIILAILLIIPTAIDGISQLLNKRESNNSSRFLTGLLAGLGLAILAKAIKFIIIY
ncbi:MAG: DUF2085 domain-containing protein [Methanobacteriaceae archaeon]|jgi:uncharacterized membrane protein|nr:DUF2085 domain-containing protein [Candidatus Methanorudis spinitermitis]